MDTLHSVMRSIKGSAEPRTRRDHLDVFREFLSHLDRAARKKPARAARTKARSARKR